MRESESSSNAHESTKTPTPLKKALADMRAQQILSPPKLEDLADIICRATEKHSPETPSKCLNMDSPTSMIYDSLIFGDNNRTPKSMVNNTVNSSNSYITQLS